MTENSAGEVDWFPVKTIFSASKNFHLTQCTLGIIDSQFTLIKSMNIERIKLKLQEIHFTILEKNSR